MSRGHHLKKNYWWSELEKVTGESNVNRLGREEKKWAKVTGPRSPKGAEVTGPRSPWAEVTCIPYVSYSGSQSHTTRRGRASCSLWYAPVANVCDLLLFLDENRVIPDFRHFESLLPRMNSCSQYCISHLTHFLGLDPGNHSPASIAQA